MYAYGHTWWLAWRWRRLTRPSKSRRRPKAHPIRVPKLETQNNSCFQFAHSITYKVREKRIFFHHQISWWGVGPIFQEVEVNSIGEVCDIGDPASNQHDLKSSNRYTTAPLVINQAQLDWPRQEGFSYKRIKEHKQERINTQSDNCKYKWSESQEGSKNSIPKN